MADEHNGEEPEVHGRLVLPLLVPTIAFLFAVLVIYGLSRVYLELNEVSIGDVTMATPLALGVSLFILFAAWYLFSNRRAQPWQVAMIGAVAVAALTGGAVWAAVHEEGEGTLVETPIETPADGTPAPAGSVLVSLQDPNWAIEVSPASASAPETLSVSNDGGLIHNLRVVFTDLPVDELPLDDTGFMVNEDEVNVVASVAELVGGESKDVAVSLESGNYVLICNIVGHYGAGMYAAFTVE